MRDKGVSDHRRGSVMAVCYLGLAGNASDPSVFVDDMIVVENCAVNTAFRGAMTVLSGAAAARVLLP